jgi:hypothetical protein
MTTFMSVSALGVFDVIEIDDRRAVHDADRDGSDLPVQRVRRECDARAQLGPWHRQAPRTPGDRRRARAAIGLQHVAVECDGAFAERAHVDDCTQRAADQALDFQRASALLAPGRFARASIWVARATCRIPP